VEHIAIDWGARESQICVRSADETILDSRRVRTAQVGEYLARRPPSRVIVETCTQAFAIADQARALGHDPRVVPATLAPALGVGERRTKNDRRDAEALSRVSCRVDLQSVHIPSAESRRWKAICGARDSLIAARTQLINTVRAWLRSDGRHVRSTPDKFHARVRTAVPSRPPHIDQVVIVLETLNQQICTADAQIRSLARGDEVCRRLMTAPGVGPVTAVRFRAALDEVSRFRSAHAVESYLGLVPGEHSTAASVHRLGITKAGAKRLRACLVQAAWAARRCKQAPPIVRWSLEVEKRRGKNVAVVALARKLAGVLFAMWRDGTRYDVQRA
jgi:transposase